MTPPSLSVGPSERQDCATGPEGCSTSTSWPRDPNKCTLQAFKNDLGNLCLTQDNSSLSNKAFPDKKGEVDWDRPCYANSLLLQERDLAEFHQWTIDGIKDRRQRLLEWAHRRWMLPEVSADEADLPTEDEEASEEVGAGFSSDGGSSAVARHATLTDEEIAVSRVRPSSSNPWVIQPFNADLYRASSRGASGTCMSCARSS